MALAASHVVPAPREAVWQWHTRAGALTRLTPPFIPMRPVQQATSLASGTTIFSLPAGLRWVARHDLSRYRKGVSFRDVCINAPMKKFAHWHHDHLFADHAEGTLITDAIDTRLPPGLLEPMLAYRQRQIINDFRFLNYLDSTASSPQKPVRIAMTGSHGAVGRALTAQLTTAGHNVIPLVRGKAQVGQRHWNPKYPAADLLTNIDVLVHLAGEPIFGRFNESHKEKIYDSRVGPTQALSRLVAETPEVKTMVNASAIGYYGNDRGSEALTESSAGGDGFLAGVVRDWEKASAPALEAGKRVALIRTGVVLSGDGGLLPLLKMLFNTGLGGSFGGGEFWFSWIALDDLTDIYFQAIVNEEVRGPVNASAPKPVYNRDMAHILARELGRPSFLPIPTFGPALLLGKEGAQELALADQRVIPQKLQTLGHPFRYRTLDSGIAHELGGESLWTPSP